MAEYDHDLPPEDEYYRAYCQKFIETQFPDMPPEHVSLRVEGLLAEPSIRFMLSLYLNHDKEVKNNNLPLRTFFSLIGFDRPDDSVEVDQ